MPSAPSTHTAHHTGLPPISPALGILFAALGAHAAETPEAVPPPKHLPEIVVTAIPLVQGNETDVFASASTVVSRQQMEDLNAMDIGSTLRTVPGVTTARHNLAGSYGGSSGGGIFIRGQGISRPGGELATLYNGVPRFNAVFSHPLLDILSIDAAHALRIYKSPQPQAFGNAFAAIDILPRHAASAEEGWALDLAGAYGLHDTVVESASVTGRTGAWELFTGQSYRRSSGHRVNSGGELQDYAANIGHALDEHWTLRLCFDHTENYAEDPGVEGTRLRQGDYHTRDYIATFALEHKYEGFDGYIKPYWNNGQAKWLDQKMQGSGATAAPADVNNTIMNWDNYGVRVREHGTTQNGGEFVAGIDIDIFTGTMDRVTYNGNVLHFRRAELQLYSPYLAISQFMGSRKSLYAQPSGGMRFHAHDIFESAIAPHAGLIVGYKDTELHVNYSRGVNYPGLNVIAFANMIPPLGSSWKKLKAELLDHYELGVRHNFSQTLQAELTGFHDAGKRRYVMKTPPTGFINIPSYENYGVEAAISWAATQNLSFFVGATWLHCSVDEMPYAPEWTASAGVVWRFLENFKLCVDMLFQDKMHVSPDAFGRTQTAASTSNPSVTSAFLLNAKLVYEFALPSLGIRAGEVFLAADNITDRKYHYRPGYPLPGIGGMLGLTLHF
ncbi:MAG: TonB-dependent receptor [Puniceicoccales bacterium]|jgi:iron complex outermembrane receptor protein|nr:TonB-dependent receptor [Puniceicoccales bacterium]